MTLPHTDYETLRSAILFRYNELKGGAGSGNFNHGGRPGEQGGSSSGEGGGKTEVTTDSSWKKVGEGYHAVFNGKPAVLAKEGKKWVVTYDGESHTLPGKASFGHAEGFIKQQVSSSGHPQGSGRSGDKIGGRAEQQRKEVVANRLRLSKKSLPLEYLKSEYKYASTQVNIADCSPDGPDVTNRILALARLIPDDALAGDGREETPHVTLKYGLLADDPSGVRDLLRDEHTIILTLGPVDVFKAEEPGADHDVIIIRVSSPDLVRLNRKLTDEVDNETTFTYNPHITLAYVEPGKGQDFVSVVNAGNDLTGHTLFSKTIRFSSRDGKESRITLGGTDAMSTRVKYEVLASNIRQRLSELSSDYKGGPGSGNYGHGGRVGERGGSSSEGGSQDNRQSVEDKISHKKNIFTGDAERQATIRGVVEKIKAEKINAEDISKIRITYLSPAGRGFRTSADEPDERKLYTIPLKYEKS